MGRDEVQEAHEEDERRSGITFGRNTAVTISLGLILQFGYVVYMFGRQSEKLDTVVSAVDDIKRVQYTQRDAERDLVPLRKDNERFDLRIRAVEQASDRRAITGR